MISRHDPRLRQGAQIAYIPDHAKGDINHSDVQNGFIMAIILHSKDDVFCRYYHTDNGRTTGVLRTVANSEKTPLRLLVFRDHMPQAQIDAWLKGY